MKDIITIDSNRFRQEIGSYVNAYGLIAISITRLNTALERSEVVDAIPTITTEDYQSMKRTVVTLTEALGSFKPITHGRWMFLDNWETFECSVCGGGAVRNDYPYCMWCGAKMDEVTE